VRARPSSATGRPSSEGGSANCKKAPTLYINQPAV
jgi:hypothetical protein